MNLPSAATASVAAILKRGLVDAAGRPVGRLQDIVLELRDHLYPLLAGFVVLLDDVERLVKVGTVSGLDQSRLQMLPSLADAPAFVRQPAHLLVRQDILAHRLLDLNARTLVRAYDVQLVAAPEGWLANGLDVHKHGLFSFGAHEHHTMRDWNSFMLLTGSPTARQRPAEKNRIHGFKAAQIADLLEAASPQEKSMLLAQVHTDPELEAHVFEELGDNDQAQLFKGQSDQDVAAILARMRADDAADAIMDLAQSRREIVLKLLPASQKTKVLALLGYHDATAGGLMGADYLALPEQRTIADALQQLRVATTQQPEALTTIHSLDAEGRLAGTLGLVRALQIDPATVLRDAADADLVFALPNEDIIAVTTRMADFNLLTLPVLDQDGRILGIVTVDDALEAAIPRDWFRRRAAAPVKQRAGNE